MAYRRNSKRVAAIKRHLKAYFEAVVASEDVDELRDLGDLSRWIWRCKFTTTKRLLEAGGHNTLTRAAEALRMDKSNLAKLLKKLP